MEETAKMWSLKVYLFSNMKCEAVEYPSSLLEIRNLMAPGGTVTQDEGGTPST